MSVPNNGQTLLTLRLPNAAVKE